ncbi:MAG: beta-hydroxyacyl-ACP dehydratase [Phycisphaera sp.]|nr:beta-hydroxyacyl-ACP dehydratase [Phycisphaera sp.]
MRFELIDQVLEMTDERIVAVKAVTTAEEYLADHFPGFAVLPGVMMVETLIQAGRKLLAQRFDAHHLVVTQARNIRFGNMVRPGQCLRVEVTLRSHDETGYELAGEGTVDQSVAVQGRFRLAPLNGGSHRPG